jgi:3-deoxy-manno-octulosonate cytidylyltransferase (CMP-KDO synthetase)
MKTAIVIPSRYASMRFPGKPLVLIKNKPLIWHVCQRAKESKCVDFIAIATDDNRIYEVVKNIGLNVYMTASTLKSGTDRIAFLAENDLADYDLFINVQGDEPLIDPTLIDNLIINLKDNKDLGFITAAYPLKSEKDIKDPNITKVVFDKYGYALYFSRSQMPYNRNNIDVSYYKHIGIYGYRKDFLLKYAKMEEGLLEKAESLEQLRALENGYKIKVIVSDKDSIGIDVPSDIAKVEEYL